LRTPWSRRSKPAKRVVLLDTAHDCTYTAATSTHHSLVASSLRVTGVILFPRSLSRFFRCRFHPHAAPSHSHLVPTVLSPVFLALPIVLTAPVIPSLCPPFLRFLIPNPPLCLADLARCPSPSPPSPLSPFTLRFFVLAFLLTVSIYLFFFPLLIMGGPLPRDMMRHLREREFERKRCKLLVSTHHKGYTLPVVPSAFPSCRAASLPPPPSRRKVVPVAAPPDPPPPPPTYCNSATPVPH